MTSNKFLNNSKFKVTIPSPSPTLYVTVARYWSPETSAQPVEHRDCQLTLSTTFHQGAVPIQTNRIAALVSLSKPSTSRPRFSPSSRSSFAAQVGGEWFSLSMRWLASKKPESSGRWHVSTVTYRPVLVPVKLKNRKPFVVIRNNQKRDKVRVRMVSNGGPKFHWAWKSVRMARIDHGILSWDLSPRRRTGEELNDREWLDLEDARFCELGFLFVSWASYSTNGEIEDIYGQITLVVSSKLLTWILVIEERLFDLNGREVEA